MNKFNLLCKWIKLGFLYAVLVLPANLISQINTPTWGVDDTNNCTVKSIEFIMVHDYIELFNNSGANQQMRWIRYTDPNWPVQWQAGFTDPDSFYVDVLIEDTAEFIMLDPIEFANQLIINVDHNNHVDTSFLRFKVYPVAAPEDSLWLNFCIIITMPDVSVGEMQSGLELIQDKNQNVIYLKGDVDSEITISLFDLNGKIILQEKISSPFEFVSVSQFERGIYFAKISGANFEFTKKVALY
jgi:hypothetical protein